VDFLTLTPLYTRSDVAFKDSAKGATSEVDFEGRYHVAPRIDLEIMPFDEWGISASWYLYDPPSQGTSFAESPTNVAYLQSQFNMQVADLELRRTLAIGDVSGNLGLGVQYLYFSHSYHVDRNASPADYDNLAYGYNFGGVGPIFSMEFVWPSNCPLQFFAKMNCALEMGTREERLFVNSSAEGLANDLNKVPVITSSTAPVSQTSQHSFLFLPTAEVEAGASLRAYWWDMHPVIKVSGIAQYWTSGGNSTNPISGLFLYGVSATVGVEF
jgi:hypothetical protein